MCLNPEIPHVCIQTIPEIKHFQSVKLLFILTLISVQMMSYTAILVL